MFQRRLTGQLVYTKKNNQLLSIALKCDNYNFIVNSGSSQPCSCIKKIYLPPGSLHPLMCVFYYCRSSDFDPLHPLRPGPLR